jgi:hypothetical protein
MLRTFFFSAAAIAVAAAAASAGAQPRRSPPLPAPRASPAPPQQQLRASDRAAFEQGMRTSEGAPVIAAIERNYPEDVRPLIDRMFAALNGPGGGLQNAAIIGARLTEELVRSKVPDAIHSPAPQLLRFNERQIALFTMLSQRYPHLCGPAFFGQMNDPRLIPADVRPYVREITIALLDAGGAGRRARRIAGRGELRPLDGSAWVRQMQAIDPNGELLALLADPRRMAAAPPAQQCRLAIASHEAIRRLPPEQGASMVAFFLAEALRQATQQPPAPSGK